MPIGVVGAAGNLSCARFILFYTQSKSQFLYTVIYTIFIMAWGSKATHCLGTVDFCVGLAITYDAVFKKMFSFMDLIYLYLISVDDHKF